MTMINIIVLSTMQNNCEDTIISILDQTYQDFKLIVVRDWAFKGVEWCKERALSGITGGLLMIVDDSTILMPECFMELVKALGNNANSTYAVGNSNQGEGTSPMLMRIKDYLIQKIESGVKVNQVLYTFKPKVERVEAPVIDISTTEMNVNLPFGAKKIE